MSWWKISLIIYLVGAVITFIFCHRIGTRPERAKWYYGMDIDALVAVFWPIGIPIMILIFRNPIL